MLASYQQGQLDCLTGQDQIVRKVALINQQIEQLTQLRHQLLAAVADCPDQC